MTEAELRKAARPRGILTPDEFEAGLATMFEQLFLEQLHVVQEGEAPTAFELLAARRRAAELWKFDRLTGDVEAIVKAAQAPTRMLARAEEFAEAEMRRRLGLLMLSQLRQVEVMLRCSRSLGVEEEEVEEVPTVRVVSGGRRR